MCRRNDSYVSSIFSLFSRVAVIIVTCSDGVLLNSPWMACDRIHASECWMLDSTCLLPPASYASSMTVETAQPLVQTDIYPRGFILLTVLLSATISTYLQNSRHSCQPPFYFGGN